MPDYVWGCNHDTWWDSNIVNVELLDISHPHNIINCLYFGFCVEGYNIFVLKGQKYFIDLYDYNSKAWC